MASDTSWRWYNTAVSLCMCTAACAPAVQTADRTAGVQSPVVVAPPAQPGVVRPLDPLTAAERETAARLALADQRVRRFAGDRAHDVALVELLVRKPDQQVDDADRPPPLGRRAEVLISVFETRFTGIRAVVDLERRVVEDVSELPSAPRPAGDSLRGGPAVPISPREVELARRLVFARPELRTFIDSPLEEIAVEYLPISWIDRELCPSGRCVELLFRRGDSFATTTAVVDIPTQTVRFRRGER